MDIRHLYYFKEIVIQGSISKAAEALHMAQPPLSQLLKKLETELGTTLIQRYRQKWELTETGKILYQYAEQMLIQMEDVKQRIENIEHGTAGTVRLGVSSACSNMVIDYVSTFRVQFPNVKITIFTGNSEELLTKLEQRQIDIALLLRSGKSEKYSIKTLKKQPAAVIVPSSWSASFSERASLEEISQYPLILLGAMEGHSFTENILNAFDERSIKPNVIIESKDISMVVSLVSRGIGLSIIPRMDYVSPFLEHTMLFELEQLDFSVEPVFVKLKDEPSSKAAHHFWEIVNEKL
ncbi:LysR family transcriptional regulator [Bacillus sp. FJAT-27445]|uniref:LysR family transcriptional regulator n=1 Tax=Bacillus sp. FJAT-27445 TaxID=1679166 RepID=UPI00074445DB|nr:LysR family transcriptional regulator [Bacillus sp. FJAT-27445]